MPRDFIPRRDAEFLQFSHIFRERISPPPPFDPATLGLTAAQVAHYAITQQAFADAFDVASAPGTRTVVSVGAKNTARQTLEAETRALAGIIRSHPGVTNAVLCELQMCVPVEKRRRVPAPTVAPLLSVDAMPQGAGGGRLEVFLRELESGKVGKPRDVTGALIMGYASKRGELPPADPMDWTLLKQTSRARVRLTVGLPGGSRLWLAACWSNTHCERGPWSTPTETRINYGGVIEKDSVRVADCESLRFAARTMTPSAAATAAKPLEDIPLLNAA